MKLLVFVVLVVFAALLCASTKRAPASPSDSMSTKLAHVEANGKRAHPDSRPTVFTEREVNAYLASGDVKMPAGVRSVKLEGNPGVINGAATIDFDKVREGIHSSNPLLSLFSGTHEVQATAHAYGERGIGHVHIDSVSLDGVEVPHFVLELFVEKFLTPRYPQIGLDSQFALVDRIDTATIGQHTLTVIQK